MRSPNSTKIRIDEQSSEGVETSGLPCPQNSNPQSTRCAAQTRPGRAFGACRPPASGVGVGCGGVCMCGCAIVYRIGRIFMACLGGVFTCPGSVLCAPTRTDGTYPRNDCPHNEEPHKLTKKPISFASAGSSLMPLLFGSMLRHKLIFSSTTPRSVFSFATSFC